MMTNSLPSFRYNIPYEDFKVELCLVEIKKLHLHEEIQPKILEELVKELKKEKEIKHPIIVDRNTLIILDGTHRTDALRELHYKYIPVCLVDYMNPKIEVGCWFRTINLGKFENIFKSFEKLGLKFIEKPIEDTTLNSINQVKTLIIFTKRKSFMLDKNLEIWEVYNYLKKIEKMLRGDNFEVAYETERDAIQKLVEGKAIVVIATPPLNKKTVIENALVGKRFPCKTTRHIIPVRPMGINLILDLLKKEPLIDVNKQFIDTLYKKHLVRIPQGSLINGRRYQESLFFFNDN